MDQIIFSNWDSLLRTLSQIKEFDFIVTVALGLTLSTVLLNKNVALADGALAMVLLIHLLYLLATASIRSKDFTKLISYEPTLVLCKGQFLEDA